MKINTVMGEILITIGEAVAWCGPHGILLCRPYQSWLLRGAFLRKASPHAEFFTRPKEQVDEESNKFVQDRLIVTSHEAIEINQ